MDTNSSEPADIPESLRATIRELLQQEGMTRAKVLHQLQEVFTWLTYGHVYRATADMHQVSVDILRPRALYEGRVRSEVVMELAGSGVRPCDIARQLGLDQKTVGDDLYRVRQKRLIEQMKVRLQAER